MIVICEICGTAHRAITRDQALSLLEARHRAWDGQGDQPDWADYEHCHACGADTTMFARSDLGDQEGQHAIIWEETP